MLGLRIVQAFLTVPGSTVMVAFPRPSRSVGPAYGATPRATLVSGLLTNPDLGQRLPGPLLG